MNIREAAVEGRFYPSTKKEIFHQISEIESRASFKHLKPAPETVYGAVLPHAGHMFSGYQTVPFFQMLTNLESQPDTFVIVHPNHSGNGLPVAVDDADTWRNSIGQVPVDRSLALAIDLPQSRSSHAYEHSAEVIIPFLQYYLSNRPFFILPICMLDQSFSTARMVSLHLLHAIEKLGRNVMVLASCDFSHFISPEEGSRMDQLVINEIVSGDASAVEKIVKEQGVSVCGYGPIMVLMEYAKQLNPDYRLEILARGHSGEVIPSSEVVNYLSMILFK